MGQAMFVSHQWLSPENPDPSFEQLEVLQKTMKNLLRGETAQHIDFFFVFFVVFVVVLVLEVLNSIYCNEIGWGRICRTVFFLQKFLFSGSQHFY